MMSAPHGNINYEVDLSLDVLKSLDQFTIHTLLILNEKYEYYEACAILRDIQLYLNIAEQLNLV